uniref:Uncharacterized protein n=1 Tax=Anguilla anguilla TaxID=7936 RepID=A0A0E9PQ77_ANGAN
MNRVCWDPTIPCSFFNTSLLHPYDYYYPITGECQ